MKIYRQGDVLIKQVELVPAGAVRLKRKELSWGEITGHSHAIAEMEDAFLCEENGQIYMVVSGPEGVKIVHEEHAPQVIPPGNYQIVQQEETTFWGKQRVME